MRGRARNLEFPIAWNRVAAWVLIGGLLGSACAYRPIDPGTEPFPASTLARDLDRSLLAEGGADRLVVEVDWVEGCKPGPKTIAGLDRILDKYLADGLDYSIELDDEIPADRWDDREPVLPLIRDLILEFAADGFPRSPPGHERRYAIFVPAADGLNGFAFNWRGREGADVVKELKGLVVAREPHRRYARRTWLGVDKFERTTLIHEFGHVLGLVTNDRHEMNVVESRHCTRLGCIVTRPTTRVILRNSIPGLFGVLPDDFCKLCRRDIERARAYWAAHETTTVDEPGL
ncbi:MAG: hypothetical protein GY716_09690 [bacterium]|nr:hypothetical protein [bacterium]